MIRFLGISTVLGVFSISLCTGSAAAQHPAFQRPSIATERGATMTGLQADSRPVLRIGPGDLLSVNIIDEPELSGKLRVANDGSLSVPLIGNIHVEGLTAFEAETLIRDRMIEGKYLKTPQISVFVDEYETQGVSVLGEVKSPGVYSCVGVHHLQEYLSLAEGLLPSADRGIQIRRHSSPNAIEIVSLDGPQSPSEKDPEVYPGDTITIPKVGTVYVIGDVGKPGGFQMDNNGMLTVLQALALAEGVNKTASTKSARLIRVSSGTRVETPLDIARILKHNEPDVILRNDDIIFVPSSTGKSFIRHGLPEIVGGTLTGLVLRIP